MKDVNLDTLVKHADTYGLDNAGRKPARYPGWTELSRDSLIEVGVKYLTQDDFVLLVERVGYPQFVEKAAKWWETKRKEWAADAEVFEELHHND